VACAAAIANLNILRDEKIIDYVRDNIGPYLAEKWRALDQHPLVGEAMMTGLIGSLQLTPHKSSRAAFHEDEKVGQMTRDICIANGLILRAVGDRMICSPPLVLTKSDADKLIEITIKTLDMAYNELRSKGLMN